MPVHRMREIIFFILIKIIVADDVKSIFDMTVVGVGYNILNGNPDGVNPKSGGRDPGILHQRRLVKRYDDVLPDQNITCDHMGTDGHQFEFTNWFHDQGSYTKRFNWHISSSGLSRLFFTVKFFRKSYFYLLSL